VVCDGASAGREDCVSEVTGFDPGQVVVRERYDCSQ